MASIKENYDKIVNKDYPIEFKNTIKNNNIVKRESMELCLKDNDDKKFSNILDLCGGKGGDILKFSFISDSKTKLTAVDFSKNSLEEYSSRLDKFSFKFNSVNLINFDVGDSQILSILSGNHFDLINMQFALHYFFKDQQTFNNILNIFKEVGDKYIIITTTDDKALRNSKNKNFRQLDTTNKNIFGNVVVFNIPGAVENNEYLVDSNFLENEMNKIGFKTIENINFKNLKKKFNIKEGFDLSLYYRLFIFKKI